MNGLLAIRKSDFFQKVFKKIAEGTVSFVVNDMTSSKRHEIYNKA